MRVDGLDAISWGRTWVLVTGIHLMGFNDQQARFDLVQAATCIERDLPTTGRQKVKLVLQR